MVENRSEKLGIDPRLGRRWSWKLVKSVEEGKKDGAAGECSLVEGCDTGLGSRSWAQEIGVVTIVCDLE